MKTLVVSALMALASTISGAEVFSINPPDASGHRDVKVFNLTLNPQDNAFYRACEWQLDVFGGVGSKDFDNFGDPSEGFAGLGLTFYPSLNFGIGVSGAADRFHEDVADAVAWDLYARVPIGRAAIYALGGVSHSARHWDRLSAQGGGGLEYRFSKHVGIFGETRAINDMDGNWRPSSRGGLRFSF